MLASSQPSVPMQPADIDPSDITAMAAGLAVACSLGCAVLLIMWLRIFARVRSDAVKLHEAAEAAQQWLDDRSKGNGQGL